MVLLLNHLSACTVEGYEGTEGTLEHRIHSSSTILSIIRSLVELINPGALNLIVENNYPFSFIPSIYGSLTMILLFAA